MTNVMKTHKSCRETAKNLFQFLRELSDLKTKKILDVNNFEKVLWLDQTPKEKEIYSITHRLSLDPSSMSIIMINGLKSKNQKYQTVQNRLDVIKNWIVNIYIRKL